ncbi:MAG: helix-turn-helix transcriptional regulator [Ruminococcaceae bacterium]|nr:helix-turn-helix transcriptional regulator [Oscillospiraceae bacterium]
MFIIELFCCQPKIYCLRYENCGVSVFTISGIECGTGNPRVETLQKIAAYTGKTVYNLLKVHDNA